MKIVLTGGGTGGHVTPLEPIVEALRARYHEEKSSLPSRVDPEDLEIVFVGVVDESTKAFFAHIDVPTTHISSGKMRRYASKQTITDILFSLPLGVMKAMYVIWKIMPDAVISKGGYGSIPTVLAAAYHRIPILLHESDTAPGATNTAFMRFASVISLGFDEVKAYAPKWSYKMFTTGTPVRSEIRSVTQVDAKEKLGFPKSDKLLLVMGGSQGAQQINEYLLKSLPKLITEMAILHITGPDNHKAVQTVAEEVIAHSPRKKMYKAVPYLTDQMKYALAAADGVVSRAGATSLGEIAALRKPALLIPLDHAAQDHQRKNAQAFESAGAAIVLDPTNLGSNLFYQNIVRLMQDPETSAILQRNLAALDQPDAAANIASLTFKLVQGFAPTRKKEAGK